MNSVNCYVAALTLLLSLPVGAESFRHNNGQNYSSGVEVNVPPEVFNSGGQRATPCQQCCIYENQSYSEGAVIKAENVLLQCQRDDKIIGTNPLVWRRVRP